MTNEKLNNQEVTTEPKVTTDLGALFVTTNPTAMTGGAHQLNKTAQLTSIATSIANQIMAVVNENGDEYRDQVAASMKSHDAMDDLIGDCYSLGGVELTFLASEDDESLDKMIRSQQSKRSRSKSKVMTQENYLSMMVGAIAENLLRLAAGKPKSAGGGAVMGEIGYSDEDIERLAQFPEELKKAIRNVQSKKSIMKSKADFDAQSGRWLQLLRAEQQLKEVRDQSNGLVTQEAQKALEVKHNMEEMLAATDVSELPAEEAIKLLDKMKEMLASK